MSPWHDYPRMITTLHQREAREGLVLKTVPIPTPPDDPEELVRAFEKAITGSSGESVGGVPNFG